MLFIFYHKLYIIYRYIYFPLGNYSKCPVMSQNGPHKVPKIVVLGGYLWPVYFMGVLSGLGTIDQGPLAQYIFVTTSHFFFYIEVGG